MRIFKKLMNDMIYDFAYNTYSYPIGGTPFVSISNIGFCGYSQCKSPLRNNESMKFTLMEVERKPVWDKETQSFKPEDVLPVSISADHRIFDGNLPVPKMTSEYFNLMFKKMLQDKDTLSKSSPDYTPVEKLIDQLLAINVEIGYKTLLFLQTYWCDFLSVEDMMQNSELAGALAYM